MFERLLFFFRRALRNMRQSPFLCAAAVATLTLSLSIVAFFAIIVFNVETLTARWSEEVQVVAYLDAPPPPQVLAERAEQIRQLPGVAGVEVVSREQAFERFRSRLGQHGDLLDGVDPQILPASLEIALEADYRNPQGVESVVAALQARGDLGELRYAQDWLQRFEAFLGLLRLIGLVVGVFLFFATLFIVSNTIRLTLFARREELEVMALVGATPMFIKLPFIIEGALQGLAGGLLALAGVYLAHLLFLREGLGTLLFAVGGAEVLFLPPAHLATLLALGLFLGVFGSLGALRKFVRI
ncbi:permease-like cell division protein FtsX [Geoalkalibacter halelectricus]|uniref:Cell division protein FtsX n=2 Tax=Geoalkalibacter halelectricus TaxID=2847045 RepID=A0ABY5ZU34_9BACT|nr:permease-like cell division protein FtsX [Geoalkalibacter halelectricus]MDO3376945.1 permease-like cell division protein FtsX [Geoalkalibacter halelectricus]UWZ81169.1 permease-like cell division protein FtsX [Geoalkalibacter halelectricus]